MQPHRQKPCNRVRQIDPQALAGERVPAGASGALHAVLEGSQRLVGDRAALSSAVLLCFRDPYTGFTP